MKKIMLLLTTAMTVMYHQARADKYDTDDSLKIIVNDTVVISTQPSQSVVKVNEEGIEIVVNTESTTSTTRATDGLDAIVDVFSKKKNHEKILKVDLLMMDIGLNGFIDKTDYTNTATAQYVRVDPSMRSEKVFDLKNISSRNFNLWPVIFSLKAINNRNHKMMFSSGIGVQWYNFKFDNGISFAGNTDPHVYMSDLNFTKNKLGITYASIPLMLTNQTRISKRHWLTYGIGVVGGYRIASWTNQKSSELGKVKDHDAYNLNPFQLSLMGEFGVTNVIRFYGAYHLTNVWQDGLTMQPFAVGIRIFGI